MKNHRFNKADADLFFGMFGQSRSFTFLTLPEANGISGPPKVLHGSWEDLHRQLVRANNAGQGLFVTINETDGKGRKTENIKKVEAVFVDLDGAPLQPVLDAEATPHLIVESSPERYHAYWFVQDLSLDRFSLVQRRLAEKFNGDPAVVDLPRVMRVPGSVNHKREEPFVSGIIHVQEKRDETN